MKKKLSLFLAVCMLCAGFTACGKAEKENSETSVSINSEASESVESENLYQLGEVARDFTVIATDEKTLTLSELLQEKELVVLLFWHTECAPFRAMLVPCANSMKETPYSEKVAVIAISICDDENTVENYKKENQVSLDMVSMENDGGLASAFDPWTTPYVVCIDRYGVITYIQAHVLTDAEDFKKIYDVFLGEDYETTVKQESIFGSIQI